MSGVVDRIIQLEKTVERLMTVESLYNLGVYTPAWTSAGTQPAIGNGLLYGQYARIGKFCVATVRMQAGSTTTFGTGTYFFSLPFTNVGYSSGFGWVMDAGTRYYDIVCQQNDNLSFYVVLDGGVEFQYNAPFVVANGDAIQATFVFNIA